MFANAFFDLFFIIKFVFLLFSFLSLISIKIPQQNKNQLETSTDKKLLVELYNMTGS